MENTCDLMQPFILGNLHAVEKAFLLVTHIQCLKKPVKCFELFECSGNISRTREGKNM